MFLTDLDVTPFFPQSGQTFAFDWFTLAYGIILVISIILGIKDGFLKTLFNALGGIIVIVVAFLLAKPLGNLMYQNFGWGTKLYQAIYDWLVGKGGTSITTEIAVADAGDALTNAAGALGIPAVLISTFVKLAMAFVPAEGTFVIADVFANGIANYTFIIGAFLVLVIILAIVLAIVKRLVKKITEVPVIKVVDKILGAVTGVVVAGVIICVVSYGLTFLMTLPACADTISGAMFLTDDSVWTFSKAVYNYNLIGRLFALYL